MAGVLGLNVAGGEFGTVPGTYGVDYQYDGSASLAALAALGVTHVRVPIKMDRLQPTPGAALDATEAGRVDALVTRVAAAGMTCELEAHNFGRRVVSGVTQVLGTAGYTQADHADFYSKLAARYASTATVTALGYNEPHDLTPVAAVFTPLITRYDWESSATPLYPSSTLFPATTLFPGEL